MKPEEIIIPEKVIVHQHKQTQAQYTVFSFVFPDGYPATLVITKGMKVPRWTPSKEIEKVVIYFKECGQIKK